MRYRKTKRDANHKAIVDALKGAGASVVDLSACGGGVPDLLVGFRGRNVLLEVKNPAARGGKKRGAVQSRTSEKQADFRAAWKGETAVVDSIEAALAASICS